MKWNLQPVWVERVAWGIAALITLAAVWPDSPASVTDRADGCSRIATNTSLGASESAVTKPIAAVRVGDFVLASDPVTGHVGRKRVTRIYHSISDHLRILTLESPSGERQQLKTTDDHPFWVPERGWIEAGDLNVGDNVLQHDQAAATIGATDYEPHPEGIPVYNFETEDLHTYFVAAHGSRAPPVLVHNCGFRSPPKSKPVAPKRKPTRAQKRSRSGHVGDPPHGPTGRSAPKYGATPQGRPFTKHYGTETGPVRNIPGSVVDNTITTTKGVPVKGGKTVHYDPGNNVTVVTGDGGSIVSVHKGPPRAGQLPK